MQVYEEGMKNPHVTDGNLHHTGEVPTARCSQAGCDVCNHRDAPRHGQLGLAILVILGTTACGANDEAPGVVVAGAHTLVVRMTDEMRFVPEHPIIGVGDTVIWTNSGRLPHTSTDEPGRAAVADHTVLPPGAEPWDSGVVDPGGRFRHVFRVSGDYTYLCLLHEAAGMVGRITVKREE